MMIRGEQIEAVGRRREIESLITDGCEVVDAGRRVVMPGFVDAHTHPVFAGIRANGVSGTFSVTNNLQVVK